MKINDQSRKFKIFLKDILNDKRYLFYFFKYKSHDCSSCHFSTVNSHTINIPVMSPYTVVHI